LAVVTVLVIYQALTGSSQDPATTATGVDGTATLDGKATTIVGAPPKGMTKFDASMPTGKLPNGDPYTEAGQRTWHVVPGTVPQFGRGTKQVFRYTVEVEDGIDTAAFGGDQAFAQMVDKTLASVKSWTSDPEGRFAFIRIDASSPEQPDFRVSLSTPMTVRDGCGYEIELEASSYNPQYQSTSGGEPEARVFINEARWVRGAMPFDGDIGSYRQYLINHEVGHAIGYGHHEACGADGALAPVMMQQSFSTANNDAHKFDPDTVPDDGKKCRFNPWPYPIA
jgi:hypothetical protein